MNANSENQTQRPIVSVGLLLAGTLLVGFSMGQWLAPLAAWIGPALIIRFSRDHKLWRGYLLVVIACILAMFIGFSGIWAQWGLWMALIIGVVYGILWSLPYLSDRVMSPRLPGFSGTLVYPLATTTLEFIINHTNPLGTWGATGFTQFGVLPIMQLVSVTGMIGITFLMGWFASVTNWVWQNHDRRTEILRGLIAFGVVFAIVFIFGFIRINLNPASATPETIRVAGITSASTSEIFDIRTADPMPYWDAYFIETVREAQAGAQVIVWPELAGFVSFSEESSMIAQAQEVALQHEIYIALPLLTIGSDTGEPGGQLAENKLLLIDPTGQVIMEHIKYGGHILESYRIKGDERLQAVTTPFGVLSGVICWDMDYPTIIHQAGENGTGLMLVPSKDWLEIDPIHTYMAVFRAIENGMSLIRQTDAGLSIAVDPYGRTIAQTDFFGATDRTMVAQVPVIHVTTIYTLFGRWLEWLAPIGLLFFILLLWIRRGREG